MTNQEIYKHTLHLYPNMTDIDKQLLKLVSEYCTILKLEVRSVPYLLNGTNLIIMTYGIPAKNLIEMLQRKIDDEPRND